MTIRECTPTDLDDICAVINDAAEAYRGIIAADRWHEPYMPLDELRTEIEAGVKFWAAGEDERLDAVMGLQHVADAALIRHAYTRTACQGRGLGRALLEHLRARTDCPMLIGTWAAAKWAIRFYQGLGFRLVTTAEKDALLRRYWTVPERQIEESVVLADARWCAQADRAAILALDEQWKAAAARRDLDGMMAIYAADAQEILPEMPPIAGRDAIRAFYQRLTEQHPRFAHAFDAEEVTVSASRDLAVIRGGYRFTPDVERPQDVQTGKFVGVWRNVEGKWRLHVNISNTN